MKPSIHELGDQHPSYPFPSPDKMVDLTAEQQEAVSRVLSETEYATPPVKHPEIEMLQERFGPESIAGALSEVSMILHGHRQFAGALELIQGARVKVAALEGQALALRGALESAVRIMSPYKLSDTWHGHLWRKMNAVINNL